MKNGKFPYFASESISFDVNLWLNLDVTIEKLYRWCKTIDLLSLSVFHQFRIYVCVLLLHRYKMTTSVWCLWFTFGFRLPRIVCSRQMQYMDCCKVIKYSCLRWIFFLCFFFCSSILLEQFQQKQRYTKFFSLSKKSRSKFNIYMLLYKHIPYPAKSHAIVKILSYK